VTARQRGSVYLLHFSEPFHGANGRHIGARHYVGFSQDGDAQRRLQEHLAGQGSPLVKAVVAAGIGVELVLSRPSTRADERKLHNRHGTRVCPSCKTAQRPRAGHQLRLFRSRQSASGAVHAAPTPRRLAA
jgi:hypothetical protein